MFQQQRPALPRNLRGKPCLSNLTSLILMLRNYFKTALRSLAKHKATSTINLLGLSLGMAIAVFIFLWVENEASYNAYHPDAGQLYRVTNQLKIDASTNWLWEMSPLPLAEEARRTVPGITATARLVPNTWGAPTIRTGNNLYEAKSSAWVDKNWFDLFHYDFIAGNAAAFAQHPQSMVLTQSRARQFFGEANALGKTLRVDSMDFTVEGIIADNPANSSFRYDMLLQMESRLLNRSLYDNDNNWGNFNYLTFLKLDKQANSTTVARLLTGIYDKKKAGNNVTASLMPLKDMYFETDLQNSDMPHGNKRITYILSLLGFLLIAIACINYVNLTTAKASLRAKEVSVRKIIGAGRKQLFFQFLTESVVVSILSVLLAVAFVQLGLPLFNRIMEVQLPVTILNPVLWKITGGTLLLAVVLNGIYPALFLSSFNPMNVFRGRNILRFSNGAVRRALVVFQFALSFILITATLVIYRQLKFIQETDPGYSVSQVMSLQIPYKAIENYSRAEMQQFFQTMRTELNARSAFAGVSNGSENIANIQSSSAGNARWAGKDSLFNPSVAQLAADEPFGKIFQIQMKEGRWFNNEPADRHNYILNETAVKALHLQQPVLGQWFAFNGDTGRIIGITKDFHFRSLHTTIGPALIRNSRDAGMCFFLKTHPGSTPQAIAAAEQVWKKFLPNEPFSYTFLDDTFNNLYKTDIRISRLIVVFCSLALFISALGLFGLAAFTAEQRTKEIGVRKVLGASVQQIAAMLSAGFVKLVLLAILIAAPLAWWLAGRWLQDFAYRVPLGAGLFLLAAGIALAIALAAVSLQAFRAATANPAKSLRTE